MVVSEKIAFKLHFLYRNLLNLCKKFFDNLFNKKFLIYFWNALKAPKMLENFEKYNWNVETIRKIKNTIEVICCEY